MKAKTARRDVGKPVIFKAGTDMVASRTTDPVSGFPIRLLTVVPICDGHDSAINTINLEFIRHGIEVIYLGYHRPARDIVRAAIQEDARAIGISSYNGGHIEFFAEVIELLKKQGAGDLGVFGGGGGTISPADARLLEKKGVDRIFFAGTPLLEMVEWVKKIYARQTRLRGLGLRPGQPLNEPGLARLLPAPALHAPRSALH